MIEKQFISNLGNRNKDLPIVLGHCVAFHSDSASSQSSSVVTTTTADSFNRTNNLVTNTSDSGNVSVNLGALGQDNAGGSGLSLGSNSIFFIVVAVIAIWFLKFYKK